MADVLRAQLVQAVRTHDDEALRRLYTQVQKFNRTHPEKYGQLPERLRFHSNASTSSQTLKLEWEKHVDTCRAAGRAPGPALWPLWSPRPPSDSDAPGAAAWQGLQRKYLKRKKQVAHFEKWYTEFEDANRIVVEQLNGVYRRLHAERRPGAPPVDAAQWLPLDDVAEELARLVPPAQPEAGGDHGE